MKTLVGSRALAHYLPQVEPRDWDYFSDHEVPGAEVFYHPALEAWSWGEVATLDELYTLKVSHSFWGLRNGSWKKHMKHLLLMEEAGAVFIPELYALLYPLWEEVHGKKRAVVAGTAEDFFGPHVKRVYAHDSIHAAVAYHEEPLFKRILKPGREVEVSRELFEALSEEDKLNLVREEVMATALERRLIPSSGGSWRGAYQEALEATITSYSKGWFPLFIVLNFSALRTAPFNYYKLMEERQDRLISL